eukprot:9503770-Pyramimonas_sp.AAC.2
MWIRVCACRWGSSSLPILVALGSQRRFSQLQLVGIVARLICPTLSRHLLMASAAPQPRRRARAAGAATGPSILAAPIPESTSTVTATHGLRELTKDMTTFGVVFRVITKFVSYAVPTGSRVVSCEILDSAGVTGLHKVWEGSAEALQVAAAEQGSVYFIENGEVDIFRERRHVKAGRFGTFKKVLNHHLPPQYEPKVEDLVLFSGFRHSRHRARE